MSYQRPDLANLPGGRTALVLFVNLLATIHVVWFYVNRVPTYLNLRAYELGQERTPFQGRLLMRYPLLWAHDSPAMNALAHHLSAMYALFPAGVRPEGIVEAVVNCIAVAAACLVARNLYSLYSTRRLLLPFVYPLALFMVLVSYCVLTIHFFRYVYDLPSLGLFSCGLYLIARRRSLLLFAAVFLVATLNRETSLFLLLFFAISYCVTESGLRWRRLLKPRNTLTLAVLGLFWIGWHVWVVHHYAGLATESKPRLLSNVATLLWPATWPQLAAAGGFLIPFLLLDRRRLASPELRAWLWVLPAWTVFMLFYGLLVEVRLFGELIPVLACGCVLCLEETLLRRQSRATEWQHEDERSLQAA